MQPEDSLAEIETQDLNLGCIPFYYSFIFFLFEIVTTNVPNGLREYASRSASLLSSFFICSLIELEYCYTILKS